MDGIAHRMITRADIAQPLPLTDTQESTDSRALTLPLVLAQVAQNTLGGIGAGVAVAALQWLTGVPLAHWRWPVAIAALVAGASTAWRAYLDEYRSARRWRAREQEHAAEIAAYDDDLQEAEDNYASIVAALAAAEVDNARLEQEIEALRIANVRHMAAAATHNEAHRPVQDLYPRPVRADARALLAQWYATGRWPGERSVDWPRSRHAAARDLLRRAGLADAATVAAASAPPQSEAWATAKLDAYLGASTASRADAVQRSLEVGDAVDAVVQSGEGE